MLQKKVIIQFVKNFTIYSRTHMQNKKSSRKSGIKKDLNGLDTVWDVQCFHVPVSYHKSKTPYYIHTYQPYTMSQVESNTSIINQVAPAMVRGIQMMMLLLTIFLMASFVSAFPVSITIFFLALPALIMNIGWLMFSQAV